MKKFSIEFTIFPVIKRSIVNYISDVKKFFTPEFKQEAYYLHFICSIVLTYLSMVLLFKYCDLEGTGIFFNLFVGGFGAYSANWFKEWVWAKFYNSNWDNTDIHMGSYGGIVAAILFLLTVA